MINNRQNGRRRGRNGNGQRNGNPGNPGGGSRIDSRARGNANQLYEKYKSLARDAQMSGDRVNTEYYLQFADHYYRVLNENRSRFEDEGQRRIAPVNSFDDPYGDEDYADEGEPIRAGEQAAPNGRDQQQRRDFGGGQQGGGQRDGGQPNNNPREGNQRGEFARGEGQREDGQREGRYRDNNRSDEGRGFRADPTPADDDADDRLAATGSPVANDAGEDSPDGTEPMPLAPRRRGRPRRDAAPVAANDAPVAIDADRLPPSLSTTSAPVAEGDASADEAPRPRRRRRAAGEVSPAS